MSFKKEIFPQGSPQQFALDLYWEFSEFENLTTDEIKKCCNITLKKLMADSNTEMRLYYDLCRDIIKKR
jgi:hypothetical protein